MFDTTLELIAVNFLFIYSVTMTLMYLRLANKSKNVEHE